MEVTQRLLRTKSMLNNPMMVINYQVHPFYEGIFDEFYELKVDNYVQKVNEFQIGRRMVNETNGIRSYYTLYHLNVSTVEAVDQMRTQMPSTKQWAYYKEVALSSLFLEPFYPVAFLKNTEALVPTEGLRDFVMCRFQLDPTSCHDFQKAMEEAPLQGVVNAGVYRAETKGNFHYLLMVECTQRVQRDAVIAEFIPKVLPQEGVSSLSILPYDGLQYSVKYPVFVK